MFANGHSTRRLPAIGAKVFLVLILALFVLPPPRATAATTDPLQLGPCFVTYPIGTRIDCGFVTVPESRTRIGSKNIKLAFAVIRSLNGKSTGDPVLFLTGGPGQAATTLGPQIAQALRPILATRDIVLVDQRGTGYSSPSLRCEELWSTAEEAVACGRALQSAGIDLSSYNTTESAADLKDLLISLGYARWNLLGGSYGSRLGLTFLRDYPAYVRTATLLSIAPPGRSFQTAVPSSFTQAINGVFDDCEAEERCAAAYPRLRNTYDSLVARLNEQPAVIEVVRESGEAGTITITGDIFATLIFQLLYNTQAIPFIPALIAETAQGQYELLTDLLGSAVGATDVPQNDPARDSEGLYLAMQCNDDMPYVTAEQFRAERVLHPRGVPLGASDITANESFLDICAALGLGLRSDKPVPTLRGDMPTLIINGDLDPATPPQWGLQVASELSESTYIQYPRGGHTVFTRCTIQIMAAFIEKPNRSVDLSCIASERQPFFVP